MKKVEIGAASAGFRISCDLISSPSAPLSSILRPPIHQHHLHQTLQNTPPSQRSVCPFNSRNRNLLFDAWPTLPALLNWCVQSLFLAQQIYRQVQILWKTQPSVTSHTLGLPYLSSLSSFKWGKQFTNCGLIESNTLCTTRIAITRSRHALNEPVLSRPLYCLRKSRRTYVTLIYKFRISFY